MTPEERAATMLDRWLPAGADEPVAPASKIIADLIRDAVAEEREACAALCDEIQAAADQRHIDSCDPGEGANGASEAAAAIRARTQSPTP